MRISPLDGHDASNIRLRVSGAEPNETTPDRLRRLRHERGLIRRGVGDLVGRTQDVVAAWERGKSHPTWDVLERLAAAYGCSIDYLVTGRESAR